MEELVVYLSEIPKKPSRLYEVLQKHLAAFWRKNTPYGSWSFCRHLHG